MAFENVNWAMALDVARRPSDYYPLDDEVLTVMASAPIVCVCPLPRDLRCRALGCSACNTAMRAVVAWGLETFDGMFTRQHLQYAFMLNEGYWNRVRRGRMLLAVPLATPVADHAEADICVICMEAVRADARRLPCTHAFHPACVRAWLRRQRTCPVCRMGV